MASGGIRIQFRDYQAIFANSAGEWIIVTRYDGTAQINIDTENAEVVEPIEMNGSSGICVVKNRQTHIALANAEKNIYITLLATKKMPRDAVEKVARNIIIVAD